MKWAELIAQKLAVISQAADAAKATIKTLITPVCNVVGYGAVGDGVTDDTDAIQAAIDDAAISNKQVYIPAGTYLISRPLVLPQGATEWGINIIGAKSETKYQYLPGSTATIIKATAVMDAMITNRGINPDTNVAYYNVVKNIVLDGNNLAVRGYINGWQDKIIDCTIIQCTSYGLSLGSYTNMTIIEGVTLALNAVGLECVGSDSTVWHMNNCAIRENTSHGALVSCAIGATISNTIFESNAGKGLYLLGTTEALKRIDTLSVNNCYFENGADYAIEINRSGSTSPKNITFNRPFINSSNKAVNIVYGDNIYFNFPRFEGIPTTVGYFINEGGTNIAIFSDNIYLAPGNISITGALATSVLKMMIKTDNPIGFSFNNVVQAAIYKPALVVGSSNMTMTREQASGTIITNTGQAAANVNITLPPNIGVGFNFKAIVGTARASNYWRFTTNDGGSSILLNGSATGKAWIQNTAPVVGDCIEFTSVALDGIGYSWIATPIVGTWSAY